MTMSITMMFVVIMENKTRKKVLENRCGRKNNIVRKIDKGILGWISYVKQMS